jgi:thioredoxin-dependent peroxiredoxin
MKSPILSKVAATLSTILLSGNMLFSQQSANALKVGTKVPLFILNDQNGKSFDIKNVLGKKNLVIYFYLRDETPGCTTESCTFRDQYEVFQKSQAMIIGISAQSVESHKQFAEKYKLPFTLLSDPENTVRNMFGVNKGGAGAPPGRVTFVVDKSGKIVYVFDSLTEPAKHVTEALDILKKLK